MFIYIFITYYDKASTKMTNMHISLAPKKLWYTLQNISIVDSQIINIMFLYGKQIISFLNIMHIINYNHYIVIVVVIIVLLPNDNDNEFIYHLQHI